MRTVNLAVKFLLELAAFASLAVWGWQAASSVPAVVLAVAAPTAAVVIWGLFAAPRSPRRLPTAFRVPLELGIFVLSALALGAAGHPGLSAAFLIAIAANALGLTVFRQWNA